MKKGAVYEGVVEKVNYPNKGIVQTEDGQIDDSTYGRAEL